MKPKAIRNGGCALALVIDIEFWQINNFFFKISQNVFEFLKFKILLKSQLFGDMKNVN